MLPRGIAKMPGVIVYTLISCGLLLAITSVGGSDVLGTTQSSNLNAQRGLETRIVNGTAATLGQFPYQVSLRRIGTGLHFCGGSIVGERWIITAAHCMFSSNVKIPSNSIIVVAGELLIKNSDWSSTRQSSRVKGISIHERFNNNTLENDLALLHLTTKLLFNKAAVQPISLQARSVKPGTLCQVAGWGYPAFNIPVVSNALLYVDLPLLNQTLCRELLADNSKVPDGMFCAGYVNGGKDACQGDSGGGFRCNGKLTGVVSGGIGCAWPRLPGLYTDVRYYRNWISKATEGAVSSSGVALGCGLESTSCLFFALHTLFYCTLSLRVFDME